jgi:hypothetical protein
MYDARVQGDIGSCLADELLAGPWDVAAMTARCGAALTPAPEWAEALVQRVIAAYVRPPLDRRRELARFIALMLAQLDSAVPEEEVFASAAEPPVPLHWRVAAGAMLRRPWPVPRIGTVSELAALLETGDGELAWLADVRGLERRVSAEPPRNYRYLVLERAGRAARLVERPKHRLKTLQRCILHTILDEIPLGDAAHGFVHGRSAITHAAYHSGQDVLLSLDLQSFFASISAARVYGIFRMAGYPEAVAHVLAGLATNAVPADVWSTVPCPRHDPLAVAAYALLGRRLRTAHLPQGAPTSPALANLAAFTLDRRLTGLAARFEARYSRYADDLTFSGGSRLIAAVPRLRAAATTIVRGEGFTVNERKSRLVTQAGSQRTCGLVVNAGPNVARSEYDQLKAILRNCELHGVESQNRAGVPDFRAHLLGRIGWIAATNPNRGRRLRERFDRIDWSQRD